MTSLHHLALTAANLAASAAFYDPFLTELGYHRSGGLESPLVYLGDGPEILVYLVEGEDTARHTHGRPGLQHLAFQVYDRTIVDRAHSAAGSAGGTIVHAPSEYPHYAAGYYATFVEDPDGSRIEVLTVPSS